MNAHPLLEHSAAYIVLAGNGRDSMIAVSDTRYLREIKIDPGFQVESISFVSSSCFISDAYNVQEKEGSMVENEIKLYPVPMRDKLLISLTNPTDRSLNLQLLNTKGQLIYHRKVNTEGYDEIISMPSGHLARGVYFLKLISDKGNIRVVKKIVK